MEVSLSSIQYGEHWTNFCFSRNSLIFGCSLSSDGEKKLLELGPIENVIRIGAFHSRDDRYYVETFGTRGVAFRPVSFTHWKELPTGRSRESKSTTDQRRLKIVQRARRRARIALQLNKRKPIVRELDLSRLPHPLPLLIIRLALLCWYFLRSKTFLPGLIYLRNQTKLFLIKPLSHSKLLTSSCTRYFKIFISFQISSFKSSWGLSRLARSGWWERQHLNHLRFYPELCWRCQVCLLSPFHSWFRRMSLGARIFSFAFGFYGMLLSLLVWEAYLVLGRSIIGPGWIWENWVPLLIHLLFSSRVSLFLWDSERTSTKALPSLMTSIGWANWNGILHYF